MMFETERMSSIIMELEVVKVYLFSGDLRFLHLLLILMGLDIVTGITKAFVNRTLWSRKSLFGFTRKLLILVIIIVANIVDSILSLNSALVMATILFYMVNEALSIIENCAQMGVVVPKVLADKLAVMSKESEKVEDKVEATIKPTAEGQTPVKVEVKVSPETEPVGNEAIAEQATTLNTSAKDEFLREFTMEHNTDIPKELKDKVNGKDEK